MATTLQLQPTSLSTTLQGLLPSTTYYFQVQAVNGSAFGIKSTIQSVTTLDAAKLNLVLVNNAVFLDTNKIAVINGSSIAPTFTFGNQPNVTSFSTANATNSTIDLQYITPSNGTNVYQYQYRRKSDFTWITSTPFTLTGQAGTNKSFTVNNLNSNTAYFFRLAANNSQYTIPVSGITTGAINNESPDGSFQDGPVIV